MDAVTVAKFSDLWSAIGTVQQSVTLSITVMSGALGFVVAAAGTALYFLARTWVNQMVERRVREVEESLRESITNDALSLVRQKYQARMYWLGPGVSMTFPNFGGIDSKEHTVSFFARPYNPNVKYKIEQKGREIILTNLDDDYQYFDTLTIEGS